MKRREQDTYGDICSTIGEAVKVDLMAHLGKKIEVFSGSEDASGYFVTWTRNLGQRMLFLGRNYLAEYLLNLTSIGDAQQLVRPDVYWVAWRDDTCKGTLVFAEVKMLATPPNRGDVFQIIGYCLLSGCKYGLLINVDGPIFPPWDSIAQTHPHIFDLHFGCRNGKFSKDRNVKIGLMKWSTIIGRFDYTQPQIGPLGSIDAIARLMVKDLT